MDQDQDRIIEQLTYIRDARMRMLALTESLLSRAKADGGESTEHAAMFVEQAKIELAQAEIDLIQAQA